MANVMISFPGIRSHILFICSHKIKKLLFSLSPPAAILQGTLAKHNSIFFTKFSDIFGGYYFL